MSQKSEKNRCFYLFYYLPKKEGDFNGAEGDECKATISPRKSKQEK